MTLFFDSKVQFLDDKTVSTVSDWHLNEPVYIKACITITQRK